MIHKRALKVITFSMGGIAFECAIQSWTMNNNSQLGERIYSFCPDGEDREEALPDWTLDLRFWSNWQSGGISDYLMVNDGLTVAFVLDHHPNYPLEHVRWSGSLIIAAPSVGGDVRTTEQTSVTLPIIGTPVDSYQRI